MYKTYISTPDRTRSSIPIHYFCGALKLNSVAHLFLWRTEDSCAIECLISVVHIHWCATECLISVAHGLVRHRILWTSAPQNSYFCGEDSVAHHPCTTEYVYWCATNEVFPTSDSLTCCTESLLFLISLLSFASCLDWRCRA
jgi:hypothetical protein